MMFVKSIPQNLAPAAAGRTRQPERVLSYLDAVTESSRHLLSRVVK
mgnify:CR=1 FL=1